MDPLKWQEQSPVNQALTGQQLHNERAVYIPYLWDASSKIRVLDPVSAARVLLRQAQSIATSGS